MSKRFEVLVHHEKIEWKETRHVGSHAVQCDDHVLDLVIVDAVHLVPRIIHVRVITVEGLVFVDLQGVAMIEMYGIALTEGDLLVLETALHPHVLEAEHRLGIVGRMMLIVVAHVHRWIEIEKDLEIEVITELLIIWMLSPHYKVKW